MGAQAHDLAAKVLPMRGRHQKQAEDLAWRVAHNESVLAEARAAKAIGPAPDGEGYSFDELNDTGGALERAVAGEPQSNADALAFLDAVNAV